MIAFSSSWGLIILWYVSFEGMLHRPYECIIVLGRGGPIKVGSELAMTYEALCFVVMIHSGLDTESFWVFWL